MKLLFICHRPYHVLRSAQIIKVLRDHSLNFNTLLFNFNVYTYNEDINEQQDIKYSEYGYLFEYRNYFDEVLDFDRADEVRIWNLFKFRKYYKKKVVEYTKILGREEDIQYTFFFSDKEKPIEILVCLARNIYNSQIILIDEGIASYLDTTNIIQKILKYLVVTIGGFKYISRSNDYGKSNIYDYSLSSMPNHSNLGGIKYELPLINTEATIDLFNKETLKKMKMPNSKIILYVSGASTLHICRELGMYYLTKEEESKILEAITNWAVENDYEVIIKQHPIEKQGKYSKIEYSKIEKAHIIDDKFIPAELYFGIDTVIISTTSSVLINAAMVGIISISIAGIAGINYSSELKDIFKKVKVICPNSIEEIFETIKSHKARNKVNQINYNFINIFSNQSI